MKKILLSLIMLVFSAILFSQPIQGTILNSKQVNGITSIQYEFSGPFSSYDIAVEVSFDGAPYQPVPEADLTGDLDNVAPGIGNIVWNDAASFPNFYYEQTRIRITATPFWPDCGQITDIDGNVYTTVRIGTQCWMKENLKATRDADGNAIARYCYKDDPSNCNVYGGLYTWTTAMNGAASSNTIPSGVRGICPDGWHLPGDAEWTALTNYVSSQSGFLCNANTSYIGKALAAQTNWQTSTTTCAVGNNLTLNDATGFSGLPGGLRGSSGFFSDVGYNSYWRTSTEGSSYDAWGRHLYCNHPGVYRYDNDKEVGMSVRCLRD